VSDFFGDEFAIFRISWHIGFLKMGFAALFFVIMVGLVNTCMTVMYLLPDAIFSFFATGIVTKEAGPYIDRAINEMPVEMLGQVISAFDKSMHAKIIANMTSIARQFGATQRIESWMSCG
jgi:hypothetical protein